MMLATKNPDAYNAIVRLLQGHGFKKQPDGSMAVPFGCSFSFECLNKYTSVLDFQLDWPYGV